MISGVEGAREEELITVRSRENTYIITADIRYVLLYAPRHSRIERLSRN